MITQEPAIEPASDHRDPWRMCGAATLTYAVGLWIVLYNPYIAAEIFQVPISIPHLTGPLNLYIGLLFFLIGRTPEECLIRVAVIALTIQVFNILTAEEDLDIEHYRSYVFWRAIYRFFKACKPFLSGEKLDGPPTTSLSEYERITVRYFVVKLIFLPMMISFFYSNLQQFLDNVGSPFGGPFLSMVNVRHMYLTYFGILMCIDIAWFATGVSMETGKYSPVKMVDPYAFGWISCLACYPPLVLVTGQYLLWRTPEFPMAATAGEVPYLALAGAILFTIYVASDVCFGLKTGNLTYKGLVDKGPYKWVRHPMYASKNLVWFLFTLPAIGLHFHIVNVMLGSLPIAVPLLYGHWNIVWPMLTWMSIYVLRGLTEERYLLNFPEYRDYCKRVPYRFIPGVV